MFCEHNSKARLEGLCKSCKEAKPYTQFKYCKEKCFSCNSCGWFYGPGAPEELVNKPVMFGSPIKEKPASDVPPTWKCSSCKTSFQSTSRDNAPLPSMVEIDKLRGIWQAKEAIMTKSFAACEHKSTDLLIAATFNKLEASTQRAWFAYAAAAFRTNVWRVPDALSSVRKGGVYTLVCNACSGIPADVIAFMRDIDTRHDAHDINTWEDEGGRCG